MHRKIYQYNPEESRSNHNRRFQRSMKRAVCIATISATMLGSLPYSAPLMAYAKSMSAEVDSTGAAAPIPIEGAVTYDLSDASLIIEKTVLDIFGEKQNFQIIDINITEDGNYVIRGSNEINGAYIDTHITVAEGVTANLIFDGAMIKNDDRYYSDVSSSGYSEVFPVLDIAGTANVYVKEASELSATTRKKSVVEVGGTFRMKGTDTDPALIVTSDSEENFEKVAVGKADYGLGKVYIEGGTLKVNGGIADVYEDKRMSEIGIHGGNLYLDKKHDALLCAYDMEITGGNIDMALSDYAEGIKAENSLVISGGCINAYMQEDNNEDAAIFWSWPTNNYTITGGTFHLEEGKVSNQLEYDRYLHPEFVYTLSGLPENMEIGEINGQVVRNTKTDENGNLSTYLPMQNVLLFTDDGSSYLYSYNEDDNSFSQTTDLKIVNVDFKLDGENYSSLLLAEGASLGANKYQASIFDNENYKYSYYDTEGALYNATEPITDDITIKLEPTERTYHIVYDDDESKADYAYGTPFAEGCLYKDANRFELYYPGTPITKDAHVKRIPAVYEDGNYYLLVKSRADFVLISEMLNINPYLNIRLESDIDLEDLSDMYAFWSCDYKGTFDGNGHVIKNYKPYNAIFFDNLYGTVKNLHFENVELTNEESDSYGTGVICSKNFGSILNCSFENVTYTASIPLEGQEKYEIKKGIIAGQNYGTIENCYTYGSTIKGDGQKYEIAKNMGAVMEHNYYLADAETEEGGMTEGQFLSGEVCSRLNENQADDAVVWYQNIDNGDKKDAKPVTDQTHGVVYKRYQDCEDIIYTNDPGKGSETPVHDIEYQADGTKITATCQINEEHTADVSIQAEDVICDGKEHGAELVYSDNWEQLGLSKDAQIRYERNGQETTDLSSAGEITASVTIGEVTAQVSYTVKAAPADNPPKEDDSKDPSQGGSQTDNKPTGDTTNNGQTNNKPTGDTTNNGQTNNNPTGSTADNGQTNNNPAGSTTNNGQTNNNQTDSVQTIVKGTKLIDKKGNTYKVTNVKKKEVTFVAQKKNAKGTLTIPATITAGKQKYKVTAIAAKACKGNRKITKVTIGKNVRSIGKQAFYGCKKLKKITIKSTSLKNKNIGKQAFSKIAKNAKIIMTSI